MVLGYSAFGLPHQVANHTYKTFERYNMLRQPDAILPGRPCAWRVHLCSQSLLCRLDTMGFPPNGTLARDLYMTSASSLGFSCVICSILHRTANEYLKAKFYFQRHLPDDLLHRQ